MINPNCHCGSTSGCVKCNPDLYPPKKELIISFKVIEQEGNAEVEDLTVYSFYSPEDNQKNFDIKYIHKYGAKKQIHLKGATRNIPDRMGIIHSYRLSEEQIKELLT